jgi:regulator of replication initiation timing
VLLKRLKSIFKSVSELEDKVMSLAEDIRGLERQGKAFLNEREALLTAA